MRIPKRRGEVNGPGQDGPVYLSHEGLEKAKQELARIERELPQLQSEVQRTKEYGDFFENAEYQAAKHQLRRALWRQLILKDRIARAELIVPQAGAAIQTVQIGSIVVLTRGNTTVTYQILGGLETDPLKHKISYQSPLGSALLGRQVGEEVEVETPQGVAKYTILQILRDT